MIEQLIGRVFATRNAAHLAHFTTKSYAQHMALGSFYEDVIEALDELVEVFQGRSGIIDSVAIPGNVPPANIAQHLLTEVEWIETHKAEIAERCGPVENLIDELAAVYRRTIYKLENLR